MVYTLLRYVVLPVVTTVTVTVEQLLRDFTNQIVCMHACFQSGRAIHFSGREESRKEGTRLVCRVTYSKWYLPKNIFVVFSLCVFLIQPALHGATQPPLFTFYGYWMFIWSYLKSHKDASDGVVPAKHLCFRRRKRWELG